MGFNNRGEFIGRIPPAPPYIGPNQREAAAKRELQEAQAQREEEARQAKAAYSGKVNANLRRAATANMLDGNASNVEMNDFVKHGGTARNMTVYVDEKTEAARAFNGWLRATVKATHVDIDKEGGE